MNRYIYLLSICAMIFFSSESIAQDSLIEDQPIDSILSWMQSNYTEDSIDFQQIALRTIVKAQRMNDPTLLGELHESLADWHGYHGLTPDDSLLNHDYKALDYFQQAGEQSAIARVYAALSIDLLNAGQLEKSQQATFKAIAIYEELGDAAGMANCHRSLTYLFDDLGDFQRSIEYGLMAYDYYKSVEDFDRMSYTLLSLIGTYQKTNQLDKAQQAAQECIDLVDQKIPEQIFVQARAYAYKGEVSLEQGKLEQALIESTKAYDIARKATSDYRAASYRSGIGDVRMAQEKWSEALPHYLATVETTDEQGTDNLYFIYQKISECYENLGEYEKALSFHERYAKSQIKIHEETIANLESEAVIKYETGKKDEAIAYQEREIKRRKKTQAIYLALVLLLVGLLTGLYYLLRRNRKINAALTIKNQENEILNKEIHHRVKNNLQILSSLLSLQSDSNEQSSVSEALTESRNRVESMGLIHQKLYTKDNLTAINMSDYIKDLSQNLTESFYKAGQEIDIQSEVQIGMADVETAIPLGLIINELITNSMKYAFRDVTNGIIRVRLWEEDGELLKLVVSDDGNSESSETSDSDSTKFGSKLIQILCKKLKGTLDINREHGYQTSITFQRYKLT